MKNFLGDVGHLVRLALVAVILLAIFFAIRFAVVPAGFGKYGHYRAGSLDDIRAKPISFAGHEDCELCHVDIATTKGKGKHAHVNCEACHGPSARHAEDPSNHKAVKPDPATLCVRCHEADSAKPKTFPQVVSREHSGGMSCGVCHNPHSPI
jgi:hypothetical protein